MRWAFAVALLLSAGCLDAYTISVPATASLRVLVVDVESQPVAGADVFIGTSNVWGVTGIDGSTLIAGLEPGPQALSVSKSGFETATTTVELEAGRAAHADITLLAKPLPSLRTYLWTDEGSSSRPSSGTGCRFATGGSRSTSRAKAPSS
ncbi:MAG: carboxypeptidase regulatory-like domain-containing protein [Euryarchaeota archaeon]|nr:carboxypeptidase regulatory-like domain-containing protein [Euryarchaeota archaeon]